MIAFSYSKTMSSRYSCVVPRFHHCVLTAPLNRLKKLGGMLHPWRGSRCRQSTKVYFDVTPFDELIATGVAVPLRPRKGRFNTSGACISPWYRVKVTWGR